MESDLPDYSDSAEHLSSLRPSDISYLCDDYSGATSMDTHFVLGGASAGAEKDPTDGCEQGYDALFQNTSHPVTTNSSSSMFSPPLGALQHALAAFSQPSLDACNAPFSSSPQPAFQVGGFLASPASIASSSSVPSSSSGKQQRSRTCSFYFEDLEPERATQFIQDMVKKLCIVQKSGSTAGIKLERHPTYFVDGFTAPITKPKKGVWVVLSSSSTFPAKWERVAATIGTKTFQMISQSTEPTRLTHSYNHIAKQFGLADDDDQIFRNIVECVDLPSGSRVNNSRKRKVEFAEDSSPPPPRVVLAPIENIMPMSMKDSAAKRKSSVAIPALTPPKHASPSAARRHTSLKPVHPKKPLSILDMCLEFVSSDSLGEIKEFMEQMKQYIASQDEDTGKYGQLVFDGKMRFFFERFVTLQTFILESLNKHYSLGIKALTTHGIIKNSEVWAALGPELSEKISSALDVLIQVIDDAFFSIGSLLIDPVSTSFFLAVNIIDAYKNRHSDKRPFLMQSCKGVAQDITWFIFVIFELNQFIHKLGFDTDPAIQDFLVPAAFTFQDFMKQEMPECLREMVVNEVPTRVIPKINKQRSKRFQTMILSIQTDHSFPDRFGYPHIIFDTLQRSPGFFRQMQSTHSGFRLLLESIQDPTQTEAFFLRARDCKIFTNA